MKAQFLLHSALMSLAVALAACSTPYRPPHIEASAGAEPSFPGIVDELSQQRPLDVLLVHGMCTHDGDWAHKAVQNLYLALGGGPTQVKLKPTPVLGTKVELHQQTLQTDHGPMRVNAIVWSPLTAPLKKQLCYDQTDRAAYCTPADAAEPYPYRRAKLNRLLKDTLLNDCLSDALIYQGRARSQISEQIQSAVLQALATSGGPQAMDKASAARLLNDSRMEAIPLAVVTESLGSKLTFDALWALLNSADVDTKVAAQRTLDRVAQIFMGANQIPLLALADQQLDRTVGAAAADLATDSLGALLRARAARARIAGQGASLSVVAFSDPNDLLSYPLARSPHRKIQGYPVVDVITSNAATVLGLIEMPTDAHGGYRENEDVRRLIACGNRSKSKCAE